MRLSRLLRLWAVVNVIALSCVAADPGQLTGMQQAAGVPQHTRSLSEYREGEAPAEPPGLETRAFFTAQQELRPPETIRDTVFRQTPGVTLQSVVDAWRTRQDRARSVHCAWQPDRSDMNRRSTHQVAWANDPVGASELPRCQVWLGSETLRYETQRWYFRATMEFGGYNLLDRPRYQVPLDPRFHQVTGTSFDRALAGSLSLSPNERSLPRRFVAAVTAETCTELFEPSSAGKACEATIWPAADWIEAEGLMLLPLLLHFRPLHSVFGGIETENCRVMQSDRFVNGRRCVAMNEVRSASEVNHFWVDPERAFAIVRWIHERDRRPVAQLDVEYAAGEESTWDPAAWSVMLFADPEVARDYPGRELLYQFASMKVSQLERNGSLPRDAFEVQLPSGTIVQEQSTGKRYLTGNDGDRRILSDSELRKMGLAAIDSGRSGGFRYEWWLSGVAVAFIAGAVGLKRRQWQRSKRVVRSGRDES